MKLLSISDTFQHFSKSQSKLKKSITGGGKSITGGESIPEPPSISTVGHEC